MEKDQDENALILEAVRSTLPKNTILLYLCLTGSRGKGLNSHEADYDVRVIILHDLDTYIQQEAKKSFAITPIAVNGTELEGKACDLFTALEFASETNSFMREVFQAPKIYEHNPEIIKKLKELYIKTYNSFKPLDNLCGQFKDYLKKGIKDIHWKFGETAPCKSLAEAYHAILSLREIYEKKEFEFTYSIDSLLKYAGKDEGTIRKIVEIRRVNKNEPFPLTDEIKATLDEEYIKIGQILNNFRNKGEPAEFKELRNQLVPQIKKYFLEYAKTLVLEPKE